MRPVERRAAAEQSRRGALRGSSVRSLWRESPAPRGGSQTRAWIELFPFRGRGVLVTRPCVCVCVCSFLFFLFVCVCVCVCSCCARRFRGNPPKPVPDRAFRIVRSSRRIAIPFRRTTKERQRGVLRQALGRTHFFWAEVQRGRDAAKPSGQQRRMSLREDTRLPKDASRECETHVQN